MIETDRLVLRPFCAEDAADADKIGAHPESFLPDMGGNYVKDTFSPCRMLQPDYHGKGCAYEAAKTFLD